MTLQDFLRVYKLYAYKTRRIRTECSPSLRRKIVTGMLIHFHK